MVNPTLLKAIRRLRTKAWCETTYETVLTAYTNRLEKVVVVTSKASESESGSGQVVITSADYEEWMATLEQAIADFEADEAAEGATHTGSEMPNFAARYLIP